MKTDLMITVASWEDRFPLGIERLVANHSFSKAIMFYYEEYEERTKQNRDKAEAVLSEKGITYAAVKITFVDPVRTWHALHEHISTLLNHSTALVDISTMPRDTLWSLFALFQQQGIAPSYVYHCPKSYPEWLSRDPGRPRLVYKLSGIATLGRPTCLIITTGFDPERTRQLMWFYEPRHILLGFQTGDQFENKEKNIACHQKSLMEEYREFDVDKFEVDAYSEDHGASVLATHVDQWRQTHNIIMTSLGPKLGAVAMYRVHAKFPETALAYTPSGDFNKEYSTGISVSYEGNIEA